MKKILLSISSLILLELFSLRVMSAPPTHSIMSEMARESLLIDVERAGNRIVAVGERGHIIYSDNEGETWSQAKVPTLVLLTAVYFVNDDVGWAVGHDKTVLKTTDKGETWIKQLEEAYSDEVEEESDEASWDYNAPLPPPKGEPFLDVWFDDEQRGFAVGAYGYIYKTNDGGKHWIDWSDSIDNMDGLHYYSIAEGRDDSLFMAGEMGTLYRSLDKGETWETLTSPYEGSFFGVLPGKNSNTVMAFGLQGHLFRSDDLGDSWHSVKSSTDQSLNSGEVLPDGSIVIVGNSGVLLTSEDQGKSFERYIRKDRDSLVGITQAAQKHLLSVGRGGVHVMTMQGEDI